jgi:hypothetical protein
VIGAVVWLLRWLYFKYRKFQGLGLGDFKLLAASAVWIGVAGVPMQLLIASVTALAAAGVMQLSKRTVTRQTALPFGPFLARAVRGDPAATARLDLLDIPLWHSSTRSTVRSIRLRRQSLQMNPYDLRSLSSLKRGQSKGHRDARNRWKLTISCEEFAMRSRQ